MTVITLTRDELLHAVSGGAQRQLDALLLDRGSHFEHVDSWMNHIHGAMAEMAVAKHYGKFWFPCYDDPLAVVGDVGRWEVRAVVKESHSLVIREKDLRAHADQPFILVLVTIPRFKLLGWIKGADAPAVGILQPAAEGKPQAWFVPVSKLTPL